jgi:hypothetical protein
MFAGMVAVNGLANGLPLNGVNTGQLSDELPNLFVPAGLTFSIWGLIYALLLGHVVVVVREAFFGRGDATWEPADGWLFSANAALNGAWIFAWHWRLRPLSLVIMLGILGTLIALLERMHRAGPLAGTVGPVRRFFLRTPLRVYLGWIAIATIANVTAVLVGAGWSGGGLDPRWWTVAVILAGAGIGVALVLRRGAVASGLVVVWALAGIILKRVQVGGDAAGPVIAASAVGALAVAFAIVWRRLRETAPRAAGDRGTV